MASKIIFGTKLNLDLLPDFQKCNGYEIKTFLEHLLEKYGGSLAGNFEIVVAGDRRQTEVHNLEYYLSLKIPGRMNLRQLSRWLEQVRESDTEDKFQFLMKRLGQYKLSKPPRHCEMNLQAIYYF